jgi:carboxyl-terminal processing protease
VAVLVDPDTASAAEMIAGAIAAYDRGVVVGARTFGKGCAQEYLDDEAGMGVLRLSTLVYALPDGRPVQKVGLQPDLLLDLGEALEREDTLPNAMVPWKGPDVRTTSLIRSVPWPPHGGEVGPCEDEVVCKALRGLGSREPLVVSRKGRQGAPRR